MLRHNRLVKVVRNNDRICNAARNGGATGYTLWKNVDIGSVTTPIEVSHGRGVRRNPSKNKLNMKLLFPLQ